MQETKVNSIPASSICPNLIDMNRLCIGSECKYFEWFGSSAKCNKIWEEYQGKPIDFNK